MSSFVVRLAILAYPRRWRRRYGGELEELTIAVLASPQASTRRLWIVLDLVINGLDERVRRTESTGFKTALTSMSALLAGMFALAGGLASDSVYTPNVQISPSIHLGAGVSLHNGQIGTATLSGSGGIVVIVPKRRNPQVWVSGVRSAVVINTKSGQVISVTRTTGTR